jgi:hypothetical protein
VIGGDDRKEPDGDRAVTNGDRLMTGGDRVQSAVPGFYTRQFIGKQTQAR